LPGLGSALKSLLNHNKPAEFEAEGSALVHADLALPGVVAGDNGFWRWLTFCSAGGTFAEIVAQRFGGYGADEVNFGIGSDANMRDGLLARLWWRGQALFTSDAADPYTWARRGDIDTWRSHIIRQEFGACANAAKALLKYQFPDENQTENGTMTPVEKYRRLPKLMKVMHATHSFESMDLDQCYAVVLRLAKELDSD
jgi:hypothetical protein